jgi:hypothetical protein
MDDVQIVEAVATSAGRNEAGAPKSDFAKVMEQAMSFAILKAHADGLANDPDAIKARIQEAREATKKQYGLA